MYRACTHLVKGTVGGCVVPLTPAAVMAHKATRLWSTIC